MRELPLWFQLAVYACAYIVLLAIVGRIGGYFVFRWLRKKGFLQ